MTDKINENNFKQVLFDYLDEKYKDKAVEFTGRYYKEFPDHNEELDDELRFKDFIDWFILEKPLPASGKTIVEEYIEDHPNIDRDMKQKLLDTKTAVRSEFRIISKKGLHLKLKDKTTNKTYNVRAKQDNPNLGRTATIIGRIHKFGSYYLLSGIYQIIVPNPLIVDPGVMMDMYEEDLIRKSENMLLSPKTKSTAVYNKYPSNWVDGICKALSISTKGKKSNKAKQIASLLHESMPDILKKLLDKPKDALKFILDKGGYMKYGALKNYDDEITFFWVEHPPESTIGILRLHGLLAVGKLPINGRMNRIALIPHDLREILHESL